MFELSMREWRLSAIAYTAGHATADWKHGIISLPEALIVGLLTAATVLLLVEATSRVFGVPAPSRRPPSGGAQP